MNNATVCCSTEKCFNEVMWAHYADNNAGCVRGFRDLKYLETP